MSRVIKNRDGVTVVEGTPAASLVKDGEKFFESKPPERMAGESIGQPRKIDENKIMSEAEYKADATRRIKEGIKRGVQLSPEPYSSYLKRQQPGYEEDREARFQEELERYKKAETPTNKSERAVTPRRIEASKKAEFRRVRSKKEAERSQEEQKATKGKFITTLGR